MATRSYRSPVRQAQMQRTRSEILEALIDVVNERGPGELAIRDVAARAGVGERTVYRHFPDRAALLDALADHVGERANWSTPEVTSAEDCVDQISHTFVSYDQHYRETRALVLLNLDPSRTATTTRQNRVMIADAVATSFPTLDPETQAEAAAALHLLVSSRTWLRFRDEEGLTPEQSTRAAERAAVALVADLHRVAGED